MCGLSDATGRRCAWLPLPVAAPGWGCRPGWQRLCVLPRRPRALSRYCSRVLTPVGPTRVVAVVVTWNRRELLVESLAGAARADPRAGRRRGGRQRLRPTAPPRCWPGETGLDVVRLQQNTGGAGGFAVGVEQALTHDPDLVWLLDDDTVPTPDAARGAGPRLAGVRRPGGQPPAVLASKVVWTDGRDHPMNTPRRKPGRRAGRERAAAERSGRCRSARRPSSRSCATPPWSASAGCRWPTTSSGTTTSSTPPG